MSSTTLWDSSTILGDGEELWAAGKDSVLEYGGRDGAPGPSRSPGGRAAASGLARADNPLQFILAKGTMSCATGVRSCMRDECGRGRGGMGRVGAGWGRGGRDTPTTHTSHTTWWRRRTSHSAAQRPSTEAPMAHHTGKPSPTHLPTPFSSPPRNTLTIPMPLINTIPGHAPRIPIHHDTPPTQMATCRQPANTWGGRH
ncbi:hypothetical protein E2C01_064840 [Portunus trituberculatus]|uniref:Uncharacterized protein n=1 Tax=Portunus trituberculatus TaxID=210409 RepID=A0A5B7HLF5_PORTR|nr:hypothetical protein [Portunus trituberculatus]